MMHLRTRKHRKAPKMKWNMTHPFCPESHGTQPMQRVCRTRQGTPPATLAASATRLNGASAVTPRSMARPISAGIIAATNQAPASGVTVARFSEMNTKYATQKPDHDGGSQALE